MEGYMFEALKEYINLAKIGLAMIWTSWISLILYLIGGFDILFKALLIMMALDYITGVAKGYKEKNMNSKRAYKGFWKKFIILVIIVGATQMDIILQGMGIRTLVLMFYVATEFLSILENAAILGIPIPEKLKLSLEQYRDNQEIKNKNKN
jgi:toxin secretion/phage lysis holin